MQAVGIFGGTFDPIHYGHLAAAEAAIHLLALDQVLFLPNRQPPHKAGPAVTPAAHREAMVRLAIASNPRFACDRLELERTGPSYTIDTVREYQARHPGVRFAFLIGMDSLLEIRSWMEYQNLLTLIDFVVISRPGYSKKTADQLLAALGPALTRRIQLLQVPGVDIASSDLRIWAGRGRSLRYLMPATVAGYIQEHRLYNPE